MGMSMFNFFCGKHFENLFILLWTDLSLSLQLRFYIYQSSEHTFTSEECYEHFQNLLLYL